MEIYSLKIEVLEVTDNEVLLVMYIKKPEKVPNFKSMQIYVLTFMCQTNVLSDTNISINTESCMAFN